MYKTYFNASKLRASGPNHLYDQTNVFADLKPTWIQNKIFSRDVLPSPFVRLRSLETAFRRKGRNALSPEYSLSLSLIIITIIIVVVENVCSVHPAVWPTGLTYKGVLKLFQGYTVQRYSSQRFSVNMKITIGNRKSKKEEHV